MKLIIHRDNDLEYYYLLSDNGELLAYTAYYADAYTDTFNDENARLERLNSAKHSLVATLLSNMKEFYDDSKECKEFLIELKKAQINKDFEDEDKV